MMHDEERPRLLMADDDAFFLKTFQLAMEKELLGRSYEFVGTVANGRDLLKNAPRLRPDVIVIDISMPLLDGLEAARQLRRSLPEAKLIFLTAREDPHYARQALKAGASGYLLKGSSDPEELFHAIEEALRGRVYVTPSARREWGSIPAAGSRSRSPGTLTPRQRQVLALLAKGKTMKEVAAVLNVTPRTVAHHKYQMMAELGYKTTAALMRFAFRIDVLEE